MRTKTFRTRAQAAAWAKRVEVDIEDKRALPSWEAEKRTMSELIDRYIEEVLPNKPPSQYDQTYQLEWWREQLGDQKLITVTARVVPTPKARQKSMPVTICVRIVSMPISQRGR